MNQKPCGIIVMSPFCHPKAKNIIKVSRVVILPEFQGFGIAGRCMDIISDYFTKLKKRVRITTSHPAMLNGLRKNKKWICTLAQRQVNNSKTGIGLGGSSCNRYTTSWEYIGGKNA